MPRRLVVSLLALATLSACAWWSDETLEPMPQSRDLQVGFLIVDGVYNTELMAPFDIFHHTRFHSDPGMRVFTVAPTEDAVKSFEGLTIVPDYSFANAPPIDVLVVPSAEHSMDTDLENSALIAWVREVGGRAQFVLSLCDGAFVLARAGLLDGREATTFPSDVAELRRMFPGVRVQDEVSFVRDGPAITSAGGAKSYDAALYLTELLYGRAAAEGVGRGLCIDWELDEVDYVNASASR